MDEADVWEIILRMRERSKRAADALAQARKSGASADYEAVIQLWKENDEDVATLLEATVELLKPLERLDA